MQGGKFIFFHFSQSNLAQSRKTLQNLTFTIARAVLGHTEGGTITDVYSFDAIEEETIRADSAAVEALG